MFLHVWRTDMRCTRRSRGGRAQDIPLDVGSNNKPRLQYLLAGLRRKKDLQYYNPDFSTPRTVSIAFVTISLSPCQVIILHAAFASAQIVS